MAKTPKPEGETQEGGEAGGSSSKKKLIIIGGAAVAVLLVGGGAAFFLTGSPATPRSASTPGRSSRRASVPS